MRLRIDDVTGVLYSEDPFSLPGLRHTGALVMYSPGAPVITAQAASRPHPARPSIYESAQRPSPLPRFADSGIGESAEWGRGGAERGLGGAKRGSGGSAERRGGESVERRGATP